MSTWSIDTTRSAIRFSVRHLLFARVRGRFRAFGGTVELDERDLLRSSVEVSIDAASIDTGDDERDRQVRAPDFLDVGKFPKLGYKSTRIEKAGGRYRIHGELTIREVTRTVVLDAKDGGRTREPSGASRAAFSATTSIDRHDFGLEWSPLLETGGVLVGDRIDIELEVQAVET
jgi:polyisoprenoid-binding protein YceI